MVIKLNLNRGQENKEKPASDSSSEKPGKRAHRPRRKQRHDSSDSEEPSGAEERGGSQLRERDLKFKQKLRKALGDDAGEHKKARKAQGSDSDSDLSVKRRSSSSSSEERVSKKFDIQNF